MDVKKVPPGHGADSATRNAQPLTRHRCAGIVTDLMTQHFWFYA
jgi:hypothetical protein